MRVRVGSTLVYPTHGVVKVIEKEQRTIDGVAVTYVVMRTQGSQMTLRAPEARFGELGIRKPLPADQIDGVFKKLRSRPKDEAETFAKRHKRNQDRLKTGDVYQTAEVVRALLHRKKRTGALSVGERTLLGQAEQLLATELAVASKSTPEAMLERIRSSVR